MKTTIRCLIVACCLFAGCATAPATSPKFSSVNRKSETIVHKGSKFVFPAAVGAFQRNGDLHFFDDTGENFSASYNIDAPDFRAACTVYVYPATAKDSPEKTDESILKGHYSEVKAAIMSMYRARLFWDATYELPRRSQVAKGKKAIFELETPEGEIALSHLYIFVYKGRFVKYRFTYPSEANEAVRPELEKFLELFQWP